MKYKKHVSFYDEIARNKRNSILLILIIFIFTIGILYAFGLIYSYFFKGNLQMSFTMLLFIVLLAVVIILLDAVSSYYKGDKLILKDVRAYKPDKRKHAFLINKVEGLCIAAGLSKPDIYIIPHEDINAFATGRDPKHASIAVTEGALKKLDRKELEGVLGHEISHIRNYDIRYAMLVAVFVGFIAIVSEMFLRNLRYGAWNSGNRNDHSGGIIIVLIVIGIILAILAPIVSRLAQLAVSRKREYLADASSVQLTRYPYGLAAALEKIKTNKRNMKVSEAISHLFIDNPKKSFVDSLFATHPPIEERIKKLKAM